MRSLVQEIPCWRSLKCPKCGEADTARILYGMPSFSQELDDELRRGEVFLGGCDVSGECPQWHCNRCTFGWNELPGGFTTFEMSDAQRTALRSDFTLLLAETDMSRCKNADRIIAQYKKISGIYFWVMRADSRFFRIYIGKSNSIAYRVQNYVSEFQPHSPNDYKLRIFRSFLAEAAPSATLDLYFSPTDIADLTQAEKLAVAAFDPLLNRRQRPSNEARMLLRDAFSDYYRSAFEQLLRAGD